MELCKQDALNTRDLFYVLDLLDQSLFLSNNKFLNHAKKISALYAASQFELAQPELYLQKGFLSNGFKYYAEGILIALDVNWKALFLKEELPKEMNGVLLGFEMMLLGLGRVLYSLETQSLRLLFS